MRKNISTYCICLVLISFFGCKVDEPMLPDYGARDKELLYMPQAARNPYTNLLLMNDEEQEIVFGAAYGGLGLPESDISITFKVDLEKASQYNQLNNTNFAVLPSESYNLTGLSSVIPKGQSISNALKIKVKTLGTVDPFKDYILPITLESNSASIKVNESLRTTYVIVRATPNLADYQDYDRSKWTVFGYSSQETTGEGATNGRAIYVIDNNVNTYWHSVWSTGETPPPHYVSFDMGEVKMLHGIYIVHRNGNPQARTIVVEGSMDGVNWDVRGTFSGIPTNASGGIKHRSFVTTFKEARYLKVIVTENARASTNIAEIGAF